MLQIFLLGAGLLFCSGSFAFEMADMKSKVLEVAKEKAVSIGTSCQKESVDFCKGAKGADKLKTCLKDNYSRLSDGCKAAVKGS